MAVYFNALHSYKRNSPQNMRLFLLSMQL